MPIDHSFDGVLRLADWGVIRASGADARSFLHGQLTQDVMSLSQGEARLAGFCSVKGRLLASFVIWCDAAGDVLLACSADVLAPTLKRLSMFVLRAKCKLSDASAELPLFGVAGAAVPGPVSSLAPWRAMSSDKGSMIRLPDGAGVMRALAVGAPPSDAPALSADHWRWLEVHSAVARIVGATSDQFVPQMINFELVGGVDFRKGCFPGQEVVARSQYRGTQKRRAYVVESAVALTPGQEIFDGADPAQPAGMVVLAGSRGGEQHAALVELKIASAQGDLHAGGPDGPVLRAGALPYPIPVAAP